MTVTLKGCSNIRFKEQNDGNDWILDNRGKPKRIRDHKLYQKFGLAEPDPKDIPKQKVKEKIDRIKEERKRRGSE